MARERRSQPAHQRAGTAIARPNASRESRGSEATRCRPERPTSEGRGTRRREEGGTSSQARSATPCFAPVRRPASADEHQRATDALHALHQWNPRAVAARTRRCRASDDAVSGSDGSLPRYPEERDAQLPGCGRHAGPFRKREWERLRSARERDRSRSASAGAVDYEPHGLGSTRRSATRTGSRRQGSGRCSSGRSERQARTGCCCRGTCRGEAGRRKARSRNAARPTPRPRLRSHRLSEGSPEHRPRPRSRSGRRFDQTRGSARGSRRVHRGECRRPAAEPRNGEALGHQDAPRHRRLRDGSARRDHLHAAAFDER